MRKQKCVVRVSKTPSDLKNEAVNGTMSYINYYCVGTIFNLTKEVANTAKH
ncbi:hypothetical protein PIECOFPK_01653 [Mycovorax composti]|jgi:hypothetical protein|uniref:Uncharacterized protein n=1 Tax=Mycovorax composti TaxID=2962693 RepID=A0ABZ2EKK5_9BACT